MNSVHLIGVETVEHASHRMVNAADKMSQAASLMESTLNNFMRRFEQSISELRDLLEESVKTIGNGT